MPFSGFEIAAVVLGDFAIVKEWHRVDKLDDRITIISKDLGDFKGDVNKSIGELKEAIARGFGGTNTNIAAMEAKFETKLAAMETKLMTETMVTKWQVHLFGGASALNYVEEHLSQSKRAVKVPAGAASQK
ncbi:Protein of unknown function [Pyronema omphalodes CBS 100304]|uniref:Uncharacterized protein n=1 Tax=Pyronema omphalodes (strain CBS 100304) TaxID=1076935 RepID=U4L7H7_PYROM|nr:Protein of unknown function [Pyronema omphalodes CBS 100304]